jgi:hypothetical protein
MKSGRQNYTCRAFKAGLRRLSGGTRSVVELVAFQSVAPRTGGATDIKRCNLPAICSARYDAGGVVAARQLPPQQPVNVALLLIALLFLATTGFAQEVVTTLAGSVLTSGSVDGPATNALFSDPTGLALDFAGNIYVSDNADHTIRKLSPAGMVSTLAGRPGQPGSADGVGTNASFNNPSGIVFAPNGVLYLTDTGNNTIRAVTTNGVVTTLAGTPGESGATNGAGNQVLFNAPIGIAVDQSGVLYVADSGNHLIRKITPAGVASTLAGSPGVWGSADGNGAAALFNGPVGLAVDSGGNVFVSDANNHTIRKITPSGAVTTFAGSAGIAGTNDGTGSAALFSKPAEIEIDRNGTIFVVDSFSHTIRCISSNAVVTTVAGLAGSGGAADGLGNQARFFNPYGLAIDQNGNLRVSDTYNQTIRFVYQAITASLKRAPNGNGFIISWPAVPKDSYQVQYRDLDNGSSWQNLGAPVSANTTLGTFTDNSYPAANHRLYRVKLVP